MLDFDSHLATAPRCPAAPRLRAAVLAIFLTSLGSFACNKQCPDTTPCPACVKDEDGGGGALRKFSQQKVAKTAQPTWKVGEDCKRTDITSGNPFFTIADAGSDWSCGS